MFSSDEQKPYFARLNTKESITAGHVDWHDSSNGKGVCAIVDDSSILSYNEFDSQNTEQVFSKWSLIGSGIYIP